MPPKHRDGDTVVVIPGQWVTHAHTAAAYAAFIGAFIFGVSLHYHRIVQNEWYGYPVEWFPSVSSTIGDRYPERTVFQIFIAICSGPRFILVFLFYCLTNRAGSTLPKVNAGVGVLRTLLCGGWTYVTSTDDHASHDVLMVSYLVATIPWTIGCIALSPPNPRAIRYRKYMGTAFFGTILPALYFFIQHKVHRVPGAYTNYAFFEWALVLFDVAFDAVTALDFSTFEIVVRDVKGLSRGDKARLSDRVLEKQKDKPIGQVFGNRFSWSEMGDAAADVYLGFTFWSIVTSLGVTVWYFPLWHMGLSGYEVAIMSSISPFLLSISPIRRLITSNLPLIYTTMVFGMVAYLIHPPESRLLAVALGVSQGCLAWTATWTAVRGDKAKLEAKISAWMIGLVASSVAKFACRTNNPVWAILNAENGGWNKTGLFFFVLALARTWQNHLSNTNNYSGGAQHSSVKAKGSSMLAAFGFGALTFGLHSLLSDSSTMILWVWDGYPVRGPIAVPHGAVTILTMSVGLVAGLFYPNLARTWTAFGLASVGAAMLTAFNQWFGYYGGVVLAMYLCGVAPGLVGNAVKFGKPGSVFGVGFVVYIFLVLFHCWVVAYAFVPGGPLVREHTDWLMATMMIFIGCGVFSMLQNSSSSTTSAKQSKGKPFRPPPNPAARKQRSYYIYILLALQLLSASIAYLRFPSFSYEPYHPESKIMTAGIWTIHFSIDNDMWSSERRIASLIKESELDVVGLLESDLQRIIMGNRDFTQYIAEELGMWADFGPGPDKHTWGAALLSKFPIVNSTHHLLPSPAGELAPAIHATLDAYGEMVDVIVFHSGQEEDVEDRRLQSEYLADLMKSSPRPTILLSYLVTEPGKGNYNNYVGEKSGMRDVDPSDWDRWCEYILYKGLRRSGYARISRGTVTDTELQAAKFVIGQPEGSNDLIAEDQVPEDMRFPELLKGEGVRGHAYHVFEGPRYFA